jgi:branched-chain amino acid transport system permease protein
MQQLVSNIGFVVPYGLSYGFVIFTISVGLVITLGLMRVVNLAHGAFAAVGGYIATILLAHDLPLLVCAIVAAVAVALLSVPIERFIYRPLYRASELDQVLMTIGILFTTVAALNFFFGPEVIAPRLQRSMAQQVDIGVRTIQMYRIFIVVVGACVMVALWFMFEKTTFGARIRAAVDNPAMAESAGINVKLLFSTCFALGSGLAAFGAAVGYAMLPLEPLYPFKYLTLMLMVVTLAGMGNLRATAIVSIGIGLVDTACRYFFPTLGGFVIYVLFVVLVILRPNGVFAGRKS